MVPAQSVVRFVLDDEIVEAAGLPADATLLEFLRETRGRTGVKEGCAEGDCGACTVAVGELAEDAIQWRSVNACIRLLGTVDGKEVVTAQGLVGAEGRLHPVQQSMVDCHASQCGFCTPGFVMSLFTYYLETDGGRKGDRDAVLDALSGNLCRCTGYRPIVDAALDLARFPEAAHCGVADAQSNRRVQRLQGLQRAESLRSPDFHAPRSVDEFAAAYEGNPDALILAGGTDIGLWVTKQLRRLPQVLSIGEVAQLRAIVRADDGMSIGAAVPLEEAYRALREWYPHLEELHRRFAGRPIRNCGTLCGNVANGSPIGDSMPALIALGATVHLRKGTARRTLPMEAFYLGYQKKDLAPGEFVESVRVPAPQSGYRYAAYKISKRKDQDISAVCLGISVQVQAGRIVSTRIAFGGMAAIPMRAHAAEQALQDQPWAEASVRRAMSALAQDFAPLTDVRATRSYRSAVAANLLLRFWLESQAQAPDTRIEQVRPLVPTSMAGPVP
jgi:xanthine dehydrogenase small subunit